MQIDEQIKEDCNYKITLFKNDTHHFVTSEDSFADATSVAMNLNIITSFTSRVVSKRNGQILAEFEGKEESKVKDVFEYEMHITNDFGYFIDDFWIPISNEKIKEDKLEQYIENGLIRKIKR